MRILAFFLIGFFLATSQGTAGRYDELIAGYKGLSIPELVEIIEDTGKEPRERVAAFEDIHRKASMTLHLHPSSKIFPRVEAAMEQLETVAEQDEDRAMVLGFFLRNAEHTDEARLAKLRDIAFRSEDYAAKRFALLELSAFSSRRNYEIEGLNDKIINFYKSIADHSERESFARAILPNDELNVEFAKAAAEFAEQDDSPEVLRFAKQLKLHFLCDDDQSEESKTRDELLDIAESHPSVGFVEDIVFSLAVPSLTDNQKIRLNKLFWTYVRNNSDSKLAQVMAMNVQSVPNLSREEKIECLDVILADLDAADIEDKTRFIFSRVGFGGLSDAELRHFADALYADEALADLRYLQSLWSTPLVVHPQPERFINAVVAKAKDDEDPLQFEAAFLILDSMVGYGAGCHVPFMFEMINQSLPGTQLVKMTSDFVQDNSVQMQRQACEAQIERHKDDLLPLILRAAKDVAHPHFAQAYGYVARSEKLRAEYAETYLPWFLEGLKINTPDDELMPRLDFLASPFASIFFKANYGGMPWGENCHETGSLHQSGYGNPYKQALVKIWRSAGASFLSMTLPPDIQPSNREKEMLRQMEAQWVAEHPDRPEVKAKIKEILSQDPECYRMIGFDIADDKLAQLRALELSDPNSFGEFYRLYHDASLGKSRNAERNAIVLERFHAATDKELRFKLAELLFIAEPFVDNGPHMSYAPCTIGGADAKLDNSDLPQEVIDVFLDAVRDTSNPDQQFHIARQMWERPYFRRDYKDELVRVFLSALNRKTNLSSFLAVYYLMAKKPGYYAEYGDILAEKMIFALPQFSDIEEYDMSTDFALSLAIENLWADESIRQKYGVRIAGAFAKISDRVLGGMALKKFIDMFLGVEEIRNVHLVSLAELYIKCLTNRKNPHFDFLSLSEEAIPLMIYPSVRKKCSELVFRDRVASYGSTMELLFGAAHKLRAQQASLDEMLVAVSNLVDVSAQNTCLVELTKITHGMRELYYKVIKERCRFVLSSEQEKLIENFMSLLISASSEPLHKDPQAWTFSAVQYRELYEMLKANDVVQAKFKKELEELKRHVSARILEANAKAVAKKKAK